MKFVSLLLASAAVFGGSNAFAQEAGYTPPKTSWGAPDLNGEWTNASLTGLQRDAGVTKTTVTEAEAQAIFNKNSYTIYEKQENKISKVDEESSKKLLSDKDSNLAYNRFWMDPGAGLMKVKGEYRTSYVVDPPSGKVPLQEGKTQGGRNFARSDYTGPETRPLQERCISWVKSGPIITSGMYNNNIQLVQTPTHLVLMAEMIHDVRVIPIFKTAAEAQASHGPKIITKWSGDSVAWYEGNTLVVETVNPYYLDRSFITSNGKATERWTRWNAKEIFYEVTIEDPSIYTQTWKVEEMFRVAEAPMYEYACHESNYSLPGILAGARQLERDGRGEPVEVRGTLSGVIDTDAE